MAIRCLALLFALLAFGYARPAAAETTICTPITSLPAVLTTQGVYCLKQHLETSITSGAAITIASNNITLDCNRFKIGGLLGGPGTTAIGVSATNRLNISLRNCGIRGFLYGVQLTGGYYTVEDNRFDLNTYVGIHASGDGSVVRRNEVLDTGNSVVAGLDNFRAIWVLEDADVLDNTVSGVMATSGSDANAYGILTENFGSGTISGNRVRNLVPDGSGARRGIWNSGSGRVTVERNTVVLDGALLGDTGIRCSLTLQGASRNNTILGAGLGVPFTNCPEAGGNFFNIL
jgi:hypothetical protein